MFDNSDYAQVINDIHNRMFIVRAPGILKYNEFERNEDNVCLDMVDGETIDTSMNLEVFGMTLIDIAKHATDGFGIALYNHDDFDEIYRLLRKYKDYTQGVSEYEVNYNKRSIEEKDILYAFASGVFELNRDRLPNITFEFKKLNKIINIEMPKLDKKITVKPHTKAKRITRW